MNVPDKTLPELARIPKDGMATIRAAIETH
jgi:hypothetical protein